MWLLGDGYIRHYAFQWALLTCAERWGYPVVATKWEQRLTQNQRGGAAGPLLQVYWLNFNLQDTFRFFPWFLQWNMGWSATYFGIGRKIRDETSLAWEEASAHVGGSDFFWGKRGNPRVDHHVHSFYLLKWPYAGGRTHFPTIWCLCPAPLASSYKLRDTFWTS